MTPNETSDDKTYNYFKDLMYKEGNNLRHPLILNN